MTPAAGRGQLDVDLVGRDLDDRVAVGDGVADLDVPLEQRALGDRLAGAGGDDVDDLAGARRRGGRPRRPRRRRRARRAVRRPAPLPRRRRPAAISASTAPTVTVSPSAAWIFDDGSGDRRGDLGVDLVGRDLDERLVGLDVVALGLVPLEDGALGDRLAHRRQRDLNCGGDGHLELSRRTLARLLRALRRRCIGAPSERRRAGAPRGRTPSCRRTGAIPPSTATANAVRIGTTRARSAAGSAAPCRSSRRRGRSRRPSPRAPGRGRARRPAGTRRSSSG